MWGRNVGRDGRQAGQRRTVPVPVAGSNFLQTPTVASVVGRRGGRQPRGTRRLGLRNAVLNAGRESAGATVTCLACGHSVPREEAREYDKHGDRWEREGKRFEHLCKRCDRDIDHQPRRDLEAMLVEFEARDRGDEAFLDWYCERVDEKYGPLEEDR
jgi:general stress protein YciG